MNVEGIRGRGRLKMRWLDTIEYVIRVFGVCIENVENRYEWRFRTSVIDTK
jgi:hypothetical protein